MSTLVSAPPRGAGPPGPARHSAAHDATVWSRLSATGTRVATLSWQTVGTALIVVSGWDVMGIAVFGDQAYASPAYSLIRHMPGGMRVYAVALSVLLLFVVYGYGQHRLGRGRRLRIGLALLAGWHLGWWATLLATYLMTWHVESWRPIGGGAFTAFIAILVARATPPDRG